MWLTKKAEDYLQRPFLQRLLQQTRPAAEKQRAPFGLQVQAPSRHLCEQHCESLEQAPVGNLQRP